MKKRDIIQLLVGLSYSTGYNQARNDIERDAKHKQEVEAAFRRGRIAEAAQTDTRRAADLMGGK